MTTSTLRAGILAVTLAAALGLSACGSSSTSGEKTPSASTSTGASGSTGSSALTVSDAWMKATTGMGGTGKPMTGMFGTIHNPTDAQVTVTGGSSPVAGKVELHETVADADGTMVMRPKASGFVIPAKGSFELKPGANHVMLMMVHKELKTGDTVPVTLTTSAGDITLQVPVRTFTGAQESYAPGATHGSKPMSSGGSMSPSASMSH